MQSFYVGEVFFILFKQASIGIDGFFFVGVATIKLGNLDMPNKTKYFVMNGITKSLKYAKGNNQNCQTYANAGNGYASNNTRKSFVFTLCELCLHKVIKPDIVR